ncbi:MAG: UxaA family hydrolase [Armatimonadota bacterium]|nr:UxaA family hydrolase [Armatimonadota bacterium]
MTYKAIAHKKGDVVAVAVSDLTPGETVQVRVLDGSAPAVVAVRDPVPLGHKIALLPLAAGQDVIEYGERIGRATQAIAPGAHVHVHNIKSVRWSV